MRRCGRRGSRIAPGRRQLAGWALAPGTTRSARQGARRVLRHLSRRGAVCWLRCASFALPLGAIAGQAPVGGAEKDARLMLPSSPSLRSMDRSFLLRAPLPCRLPSLSASGVASRDERGFDFRRANRVKRGRANHTRCMCKQTVKRFRTKRAQRCAEDARDVARGMRRWRCAMVRKLGGAVRKRIAAPAVDDLAHAAAAGRSQPARPAARRSSGACQPRRAIGTTGRCAGPV